jgi:hypothetical protein
MTSYAKLSKAQLLALLAKQEADAAEKEKMYADKVAELELARESSVVLGEQPTAYDKEKWSLPQVCLQIMGRIVGNLNKRDGQATNSRGNKNEKMFNPDQEKAETFSFCNLLALCPACFEAGVEPAQCIFLNRRGVEHHRAPNKKKAAPCVNKKPKDDELIDKKTVHVEGRDWMNIWIPGCFDTFSPSLVRSFHVNDTTVDGWKHPGWRKPTLNDVRIRSDPFYQDTYARIAVQVRKYPKQRPANDVLTERMTAQERDTGEEFEWESVADSDAEDSNAGRYQSDSDEEGEEEEDVEMARLATQVLENGASPAPGQETAGLPAPGAAAVVAAPQQAAVPTLPPTPVTMPVPVPAPSVTAASVAPSRVTRHTPKRPTKRVADSEEEMPLSPPSVPPSTRSTRSRAK